MTPLLGELPENPSTLSEREIADWAAKADSLVNTAQGTHAECTKMFTNALAEDKLDPVLIDDRFAKSIASYENYLHAVVTRRCIYIHLEKGLDDA